FSIAKARRELGYSHQPATQALAATVGWFASRQATSPATARRWTDSSVRAGGDSSDAGAGGSS
ncbi:MAG TPA: hypothetical protein VG325_12640, partial [Solirubrobacteraceae bacterium]|nr:hypothetical protein [Solirubrobacteraceae bacterium]